MLRYFLAQAKMIKCFKYSILAFKYHRLLARQATFCKLDNAKSTNYLQRPLIKSLG